MKILVVADDAGSRRAVRGVLERVGTILEASTRQETVRLIAAEKPDLMVLDVARGSHLDGAPIILAARMVDIGLPVVMLSGGGDDEAVKRARGAGAKACIRKPFDPEALRGEARRLLQRTT